MKLIYLAQTGLMEGWAHSIQILKMCEAFAENGVEVTLVIPNRQNINKDKVFEYYNIKPIFKIVLVPYIDFFQGDPSPVWYWLRFVSFLMSSRIFLLTQDYDVLYTRELYIAPFFRNVFVERHSFSSSSAQKQLKFLSACTGIIVLTSFIKSKMMGFRLSGDKIILAPDGVRVEDFMSDIGTDEARKKLGIKNQSKIFGYVGTLKTMGMEKGVATAIRCLKNLPVEYSLYVVGGEKEDIEYYKKISDNEGISDRVIFAGKVSHGDVPLHISACDCLVAPFPENEHYSYFMSPLKIFEYMASKRPMVVSDLPSLREVLRDGDTALFIRPDNSADLAQAILKVCSDTDLYKKLSENAYKDVFENYTWKKRAEKILSFIRLKI